MSEAIDDVASVRLNSIPRSASVLKLASIERKKFRRSNLGTPRQTDLLTFLNLGSSTKLKKGKQAKQILKDISGSFEEGLI